MIIKRISVGSYGRIRDGSFDVGPGMTVFHGPNESGKTTVMEFVRNTLVPSNRRNAYPEHSKTDSGTVLTEEDGTEKEVSLEQKTRKGEIPGCIEGLEPDLYRSIFALNPSDLDNDALLTKGEISQRFLAIPGGDGMPDVVSALDKEVNSVLGKTYSSDSELVRNKKNLEETEGRIAELRGKVETYGQLAKEKEALENKLESTKGTASEDLERHNLFVTYESQKQNYELLKKTKEKRRLLGDFKAVSPEDAEKYRTLKAKHQEKKDRVDASKSYKESMKEKLGNIDLEAVGPLRTRIEEALAKRTEYRYRVQQGKQTESTSTVVKRKPSMPLLILGIIMAVIGLAGASATPIALAVTAVGGVIAIMGVVKGQTETVVTKVPEAVTDDGFTDDYETEVSEIMAKLGLRSMGTEADLSMLEALVKKTDDYDDAMKAYRASRSEMESADNTILRLISPYGGEQGFLDSMKKTAEAERLDSSIDSISAAIRNSGLDPDVPVCPVDDYAVDQSPQCDISKRIGELDTMMKSILDTEELDSLIDKRGMLLDERNDILRRGAVAYLAMTIVESACDSAYSTVQPGVMSTADRYLGMMTEGKYSFDLNPRTSGIVVRDADGTKTSGQWSTGLRSQIMLSLKLAVAKELGNGDVPMILDDVLLPFDSERKKGAIDALSEVAGEMQILYFTCDDQTRDLAAASDGVSVIEM